MNKRLLIHVVALTILLHMSAWAAPLFPDVPDNHWASDAVAALAAKGLVEGYPDGTFKGDRASSRYEVAMILARMLAKMEQAHATFATKAELEELRKLVNAYRDELEAFGVRVTNLEESVGRIDLRVSELERIRFYGRLHFVGVSNNTRGANPQIGTIGNPGIDWSTGRLLVEGTGLSSAAVLGLNADLTDDLLAGAEFVAFSSQGVGAIDAYWGPSAPYTTNPWTASGNSVAPGAQASNNQPFTRMVLDNFWVLHKPTESRVTIGSYFNRYAADFVINGARNPNIHRPQWLPFQGANAYGTIGGPDSGWKYEAFYSILPELTTYGNHTHGGTIRYEFEEGKGFAAVTYARTQNERVNDGVLQGAAAPLIPLPAVPFTGPGAPPVAPNSWLDNRNNTARTLVGPQAQNTWGIEFDYQIYEEADVRILAEYAGSDYNPDTSGLFFNTSSSGDLFKVGVSAAPIEGLELGLEYMSIDPNYDPFIAGYPVPTGIPVFLPYGTYYSNYYQLHDYLNYPNNREGFKFFGSYRFNEENTRVYLTYQHLDQKNASTPGQIQSVGNIEPLFPILQAGGGQTGSIDNLGVGVGHRWDNGLQTDFEYYRYAIDRGGPAVDTIDLVEDIFRFSAEYPINEEFDLRGGIYHLDFSGRSGLLNTAFSQTIPNVGIDWNMAENTRLSVDYRFHDLDNRAAPNASYNGSQLLVEVLVDF